jgi:carbon monoxide dehydrogenase subunit G
VKVQGTYTFEAPLETVWNALFDPEVLARTLPGCEKLEREGNQFKGDINVKMGPVQGKFQGKVDITDIKELESYTMIVDGRGPAGFGKATALMRVHSEGTGTRLDYDSDVQVGGKIASVGQRLIDASSRAIVKQSLEGLNAQIKALAVAPAAAPVPRAAPSVPLAAAPEPRVVPSGAAVEASLAAEPAPLIDVPAPAVDLPPAGSPPAARAADGSWFSDQGPTREAAAIGAAPGAAAVRAAAPRQPARGPSQASFAFGVAKEVTKELFPLRKILLVLAVLALAWLIFSALSGS